VCRTGGEHDDGKVGEAKPQVSVLEVQPFGGAIIIGQKTLDAVDLVRKIGHEARAASVPSGCEK